MRSTTTSETPSTSDNRRVRVLEQAAHVIPPIERDRATGPCSSAGDSETSGSFSVDGGQGTAWGCASSDWHNEHWAMCLLRLAESEFKMLWEKLSRFVAARESCGAGDSMSNPAVSMDIPMALWLNSGSCRTLTDWRTMETSTE